MPTASAVAVKKFRSSLPLANPDTLFSVGVWAETFEFVGDYLHTTLDLEEIDLSTMVDFKSVFFSKILSINFVKAKKLLLESGMEVGEIKINEPQDRDSESKFSFQFPNSKLGGGIYEYMGSANLHIGSAMRSNQLQSISPKDFPTEPAWKTDVKSLIKFFNAVEHIFLSPGRPYECRCFMTVTIPHCKIEVGCLFEPVLREGLRQAFRGLHLGHRRFIKPRFDISFL